MDQATSIPSHSSEISLVLPFITSSQPRRKLSTAGSSSCEIFREDKF